jgi:hypothetical protein
VLRYFKEAKFPYTKGTATFSAEDCMVTYRGETFPAKKAYAVDYSPCSKKENTITVTGGRVTLSVKKTGFHPAQRTDELIYDISPSSEEPAIIKVT